MTQLPTTPHAAPAALSDFIARLFSAAGLPDAAAQLVAEALVEADCEGIPSHGAMLVPMYLERMRAGSISLAVAGTVVNDDGSTLVLDAGNVLGQLTAQQAVDLLAERTATHGLAAVAVRNACHFGTAGHWASALAAHGYIGVVMSNTRPLMPAPGGAERVVGNNPLAIALPGGVAGNTANPANPPIVLDMALSASAMGKIRLAESAGQPIPPGWATDAAGQPTTDPSAAIAGMLLPAAGPKGFGLAFIIDMLCGGLSSGAIGAAIQPLFGDTAVPYNCAHLFIAIDVARFRPLLDFSGALDAFAASVRGSTRAPGVEQLYTPGELAWRTRQRHALACPIEAATVAKLRAAAAQWGVSADGVFNAD